MIKSRPKLFTFETFSSTLKFYREKASASSSDSVADLIKVLDYAQEKKEEPQVKANQTKYLKLVASLWQNLSTISRRNQHDMLKVFQEKKFCEDWTRLSSSAFTEKLHLKTLEIYQEIINSTPASDNPSFISEIRFKLASFVDNVNTTLILFSDFFLSHLKSI